MTMRNDIRPSGAKSIASGALPYTAGPDGSVVGVLAGAAGTVTVTDELGNSTTLPVAAGIPIHIGIAKITAFGTITSIIALLA